LKRILFVAVMLVAAPIAFMPVGGQFLPPDVGQWQMRNFAWVDAPAGDDMGQVLGTSTTDTALPAGNAVVNFYPQIGNTTADLHEIAFDFYLDAGFTCPASDPRVGVVVGPARPGATTYFAHPITTQGCPTATWVRAAIGPGDAVFTGGRTLADIAALHPGERVYAVDFNWDGAPVSVGHIFLDNVRVNNQQLTEPLSCLPPVGLPVERCGTISTPGVDGFVVDFEVEGLYQENGAFMLSNAGQGLRLDMHVYTRDGSGTWHLTPGLAMGLAIMPDCGDLQAVLAPLGCYDSTADAPIARAGPYEASAGTYRFHIPDSALDAFFGAAPADVTALHLVAVDNHQDGPNRVSSFSAVTNLVGELGQYGLADAVDESLWHPVLYARAPATDITDHYAIHITPLDAGLLGSLVEGLPAVEVLEEGGYYRFDITTQRTAIDGVFDNAPTDTIAFRDADEYAFAMYDIKSILYSDDLTAGSPSQTLVPLYRCAGAACLGAGSEVLVPVESVDPDSPVTLWAFMDMGEGVLEPFTTQSASGYYSYLKDTLRGLGVTDAMDYLPTPVVFNQADAALFGGDGLNGIETGVEPVDTVLDTALGGHDPCPFHYDPSGAPDACLDTDLDGVPDGQDNCPDDANADQADADGDGIGDACDDDSDNDGVPDDEDICPGEDDNLDTDGDTIPDCLDDDADGDGVDDGVDNCPAASNASQSDLDGDGIGDACDDDIDGDGVPNDADRFPYDRRRW
jgi:hypothetical protein